jgi:CHAT domain-containing protein
MVRLVALLLLGWLIATPAVAADASLTLHSRETFPHLEDAFKARDRRAFDLAVDNDVKGATVIMNEIAAAILARNGPLSRQMLDYRRREAQLLSIAGDPAGAMDRIGKAVEIARKHAAMFVVFGAFDDYEIMADAQTVAFREFVSLAAAHRNQLNWPDVDEIAFRVAQLSELNKVALTSNRKINEIELPEGEDRNLFTIAWRLIDEATPLRQATAMFREFGDELIQSGYTTKDELDYLDGKSQFRHDALGLLDTFSDRLEPLIVPQPLGFEEVRNLLAEDEAFVSFVDGNEGSLYVFCVTRNGHLFKELNFAAHDVEEAIALLRREMRVPDGRGATRLVDPTAEGHTDILLQASRLYKTLFGPIELLLANKRHLLLNVQGELAKLPFEMLVTRHPEPDTDFASAAWVVRRHAITVLPGTATLRARRRAPVEVNEPLRFLGVGDPDFGALRGWDRSPHETRDIGTLQPLPESADEVSTIAAAFGPERSTVLLGQDATEIRLVELSNSGELIRFDVMLFATHGLQPMELEEVLKPALALTPSKKLAPLFSLLRPFAIVPQSDGALESHEIESLAIDADLVILSACNTGTDSPVDNEGYSGLAHAFLKAGARSLMVSHWPVISDAAVDITTGTMAKLDGARPSGRALALAYQAALLEIISAGGAKSHPRYWAAFSILGRP